ATLGAALSITPSAAPVPAGATLTINGTGFDPNPLNDSVTLASTGALFSSVTVTAATTTSLTVTFTATGLSTGTAIVATVATDGAVDGPTEVATVSSADPTTSTLTADANPTGPGILLTLQPNDTGSNPVNDSSLVVAFSDGGAGGNFTTPVFNPTTGQYT